MPTDYIRDKLLESSSFQEKIDALIIEGIGREFPALALGKSAPTTDWSHLLLCASAFARSDHGRHQAVSLRIADTCLRAEVADESQKDAAAIILDTMANQQAQKLAVDRGLIKEDWPARVPFRMRSDWLIRHGEDAIATFDSPALNVNRFQKDFWSALTQSREVSASAPTSAGKSFILRKWIAEVFSQRPTSKIAIIVPTRALIQEFASTLESELRADNLPPITIHTLPLDDSLQSDGGHLCVFTQERLHILLTRSENAAFDVLIVDEAQKIGDSYRGILLQQVIEQCQANNGKMQIVFASPFVENPEYLLSQSNEPSLASIARDVTTVTQNLLFLEQQRGNSKKWSASFMDGERRLPVGTVELPFRPTPDSKRLTLIALAMGRHTTGNLVYANGPADAEKYANHIFEGLKELEPGPVEIHPRVKELIKLVQKTIHKKYHLVETLTRGVAYHYGNMPLLVRTEIEELFRLNIIRFLVCTGTLIEGVNLPCRAIFLRGPTKGLNQAMKPHDFWNLAGRAGRWGKEFHGSIVCVDATKPGVWKEPPPTTRVRTRIASSTETCVADGTALLKYIENGYPEDEAIRNPELDYVISFAFHLAVRDGSADLGRASLAAGESWSRIQEILKLELEEFPMSHDLIFRHPGILPNSMIQLLKAFESMSEEELLAISPIQPEADESEARYQKIFEFINEHLRAGWSVGGEFQQRRLLQLARLAVGWMKGRPLAVLITSQIKLEGWKQEQGYKFKNVPSTIIGVMKDVEEYARFKIPKFLRAFLDVLYFHAEERGIAEKMIKLPDLELWLELGVSTRTQLAFMELGLSRTSAIELMGTAMNTELSKVEALEWLQGTSFAGLDLPGPVLAEIQRTLLRYERPTIRKDN